MTVSVGLVPLSSEFVSLVRLANQYMAVYVSSSENKLISLHPEVNPLIAYEAAKVFGLVHKVPVVFGYFSIDNPVITIIKTDEVWVPVKIFSANIEVIFFYNTQSLWGQYNEVYRTANRIAEHFNMSFLPRLGIDLQNNLVKISHLKV